MIKSLLVSILPIIFTSYSVSQPMQDSLWNLWEDTNLPDSVRLKAIADLNWNGYLFYKPDSAFLIAQLQYDFAEQTGDKRFMIDALNTQGISYSNRGNFALAIDFLEKVLVMYKEVDDQKGIALTLNNIGQNYQQLGHYPLALDNLQKSLTIKENLGDSLGMAASISNIGLIYAAQLDYARAFENFERSLEIREKLGDRRGLVISLTNMGNISSQMGDQDRALELYQRSLEISEELADKNGMANSLNNIGNIKMIQDKKEEALEFYQKGLALYNEVGNTPSAAGLMSNLGGIYLDKREYSKALEFCHESLLIVQKLRSLPLQRGACQCLYDTYKALGNQELALRYYEQLVSLKDSLFNEAMTKRLTRLEMQHEFDKKEAAAQLEQEKKDALAEQELRRQKLIGTGLLGGLLFVALFAGVFMTQRNRIAREKLRSEELLLNILPEEVADELKAKGHSDAQLIDLVTVLFTDFKGFTALSEKVTPKDLVSDLHECFSKFDLICEKYGIEKIKTIGDAYMAAGGLPTPNRTHAEDVVNAALDMVQFVQENRKKKIEQNLPFFEIRVGVHTGSVVAGIVGIKKFQYDIWGDTVNTASRMESSGAIGRVNISESTYELVGNQYYCEDRGVIEAKGKGKMKMYFVNSKIELPA